MSLRHWRHVRALTAHKRSADFQQFVDEQILPAYPQADLIFLIGEARHS